MKLYRSILALVLAFVTTLVVSLALPVQPAMAATATPSIEQVQRATDNLQALRDRMTEIETAIAADNWNDVRSFIHGPLGDLRARITRLGRLLPESDQRRVRQSITGVYDHLNALDTVAASSTQKPAKKTTAALKEYEAATNALDALLLLSPAS